MKRFLCISFVSAFAFFNSTLSHAGQSNKIVGGELVDPAITYTSYIVSIGGGCAGSIIAPKWILTAAHCESIFSRAITAGSVNLKDANRIKLVLKESYIHPKNDGNKYSYDIALLELKEPIDFEATGLGTIALLDPELVKTGAIDDGVISTVLGWGSMNEGGSVTSLMRKVDVPIVSRTRANAKNSYNGAIDESMIAAGLDKGTKDSCQGDSGGPLTIQGSDGQPILAGIVSWGKGCARAKYFGIYSSVAVGYPWIMETIASKK